MLIVIGPRNKVGPKCQDGRPTSNSALVSLLTNDPHRACPACVCPSLRQSRLHRRQRCTTTAKTKANRRHRRQQHRYPSSFSTPSWPQEEKGESCLLSLPKSSSNMRRLCVAPSCSFLATQLTCKLQLDRVRDARNAVLRTAAPRGIEKRQSTCSTTRSSTNSNGQAPSPPRLPFPSPLRQSLTPYPTPCSLPRTTQISPLAQRQQTSNTPSFLLFSVIQVRRIQTIPLHQIFGRP